MKLNVLVMIALFVLLPLWAQSEATITEQTLTLPTYPAGAPDPNPRFFEGRVYQGAQGRIYPYPITDVLTDKKANKDYKAVLLENEYIEVCVLPEIGGRIFSALDKTNEYDFFYRQRVVKPALIGMLGAWISGGVEWNFPHHHRANTFMPMQYTVEKNADGSQTVWLTEIERRHRMKFLIGLTIYPGKSYIEATLKILNRTPLVHSFLYFANPAVHVDDTYQVIFPPQTEFVTQHAKREFAEWPIANSPYGGRDYNNLDISWWKNLTKAVSFFCWEYTQDYFAGYNHGLDAGVAYVGNHHIAPGKKFFTFGSGDEGKMWDTRLTDADGPYLELMAGAYSDNQPDYSWIQPYETKIIKQYWFPLRNLKGMKYANLHGALNLETGENGRVQIGVNTTESFKNASIVLSANGAPLFSKRTTLAPDSPFYEEMTIGHSFDPATLLLTVTTSDGKEILRYQPVTPSGATKPQPVTPPGNPKEFKTNEELFLAGQRLDQFHNAQVRSLPYYEEALARDPNDSRVHAQMGILAIKDGDFAKAEEHLRRAVGRLTHNYTRPYDCEAHYYLGLALRHQNKRSEAYDEFYKAAWDAAWKAAAHFQLAELDCQDQNYVMALEHLEESLACQARNPKALNLKSAVLRILDRTSEAKEALAAANTIDPLDFMTEYEQASLRTTNARLPKTMIDYFAVDAEYALELAADYIEAGFFDAAKQILSTVHESKIEHPMVLYYLAYCTEMTGDLETAKELYGQASHASPLYGFPYRLESIEILNHAMERNSADSLAPYLLGNLFYDSQPQRAVELWKQSLELGNTSYLTQRNLGYAIAREGNHLDEAIAYYEKAIALKPDDPRLYYELDRLYESAQTAPEKRLALLQKNRPIVEQRDDALSRLVELDVRTGNYDDAIDILTHRHFFTWEGGGEIHTLYVEAQILRGKRFLAQNQPGKALIDFRLADEYPVNLEVGRPLSDPLSVRSNYYIGKSYQGLGDKSAAEAYFQQSASVDPGTTDLLYYQALAHRELGNDEKAGQLFARLIETGEKWLQGREEIDFFAKFGERQSQTVRQANAHYFIGLGSLGQGDRAKAKEEFRIALDLNVNHLWAHTFLSEIESALNDTRLE